jgi:hypothetical protein
LRDLRDLRGLRGLRGLLVLGTAERSNDGRHRRRNVVLQPLHECRGWRQRLRYDDWDLVDNELFDDARTPGGIEVGHHLEDADLPRRDEQVDVHRLFVFYSRRLPRFDSVGPRLGNEAITRG